MTWEKDIFYKREVVFRAIDEIIEGLGVTDFY